MRNRGRRPGPWLAAAAALAAVVLAAVPTLAAGQGAAQSSVSAGRFVVPAGSVHRGDISVGAGTVVVRGTEIGSVHVGMGEIEVSGHVTGSAQIGMGQIVLSHDAVIGGATQEGLGQLVRLGPGVPLPQAGQGGAATQSVMAMNAMPWGAIFASHRALPGPGGFGIGPWLFGLPFGAAGLVLGLLTRVSWWLLSLAVALALLALFPEPTKAIARDIEGAPGLALGWGLLVALAAGPAIILLVVTLLGIPLAGLLAIALLAAKVMGYVAVSLILGARVLPPLGVTDARIGWTLVAGTLLLLLVGSIPLLGGLVDLVVALAGIGACGRTGFGSGRPWFRPARPAPSPQG